MKGITEPAPLPPMFRRAETLWGAGNAIGYIEAFAIPDMAVGYRIYYFNWASYPHANPNQRILEMRSSPYMPWEQYFSDIKSPFQKKMSLWEVLKYIATMGGFEQQLGIIRPPNAGSRINYDYFYFRSHIFAFGDMLEDGRVTFMSLPSFYYKIKDMIAGTRTLDPAKILQFPLAEVQGNPHCFLLSADCIDGQTPLLVSGFMDFEQMRPLQKRLLDLLALAQGRTLAGFLTDAAPLVAQKIG